MPATRLIIDMQPLFDAAEKTNVIVGVTAEIVRAMTEKAPIMVVEFAGCGETHQSILDLLKGYRLKARIGKLGDDGSMEITRALNRTGFSSRQLRVCGVNTNCCVEATVMGLVQRLPNSKIEVVKNACEWCGVGRYDWRRYFRHRNVKLV
jgi:nicotinamidase-related amidase